jgi:hypothetical protein
MPHPVFSPVNIYGSFGGTYYLCPPCKRISCSFFLSEEMYLEIINREMYSANGKRIERFRTMNERLGHF